SRLRFVWSLPSLIGHGPDTLVQGKSVQNDVPSENPGPAYKLAYTTSPRGIRENSGRFRPRSLGKSGRITLLFRFPLLLWPSQLCGARLSPPGNPRARDGADTT